jgi:hypothetical protein
MQMKTYDKIKNLLDRLPHKIEVSFALYCAEDAYPLAKDNKKAKLCIDLVKEWLENPDRPSLIEELKAVSRADITNVSCAAAHAAYAAANAPKAAVYAAYAAHAASYAAANAAAQAAFYSARTTINAAYGVSYDEKIKEYYGVLLGYLTKVEKVLYSQEEK